MGITSLQVCMDSSDWFQAAISEENMDSSPITTPTGDEILTCSRPLIERRLRPQHEQALKCPRCDSTHTKFCYYNNYSLSQPRYFCKTCRRYWTKGGTLRNIPVGGGCRKNKKVSKKPSSSASSDQINLHRPSGSALSSPLAHNQHIEQSTYKGPTDLQLAFPEQLNFWALNGGGLFNPINPGFLFENINPTPIEFMDNKYDNFMVGNNNNNNGENFGGMQNPSDFNGVTCAPFGLATFDHHHHGVINNSTIIGMSYENHEFEQTHNHDQVDVKPINANKILSLEWHDHQQAGGIKDSYGYNFGGLGSWTGLMNGYGSSATNPLV